MHEINKDREEICEQCEMGIEIENCRECIFNLFCRVDEGEDLLNNFLEDE